MRYLCLGVVLLLLGCEKDPSDSTEAKSIDESAKSSGGESGAADTAGTGTAAGAGAAGERPKMTNTTMRDIVDQTIAQARGGGTPTPATPTPAPIDPLPPEEPLSTTTPPGPTTTTAPPTTTTQPPAATDELKVGDRVMAKWTNGRWYPGRIVGIRDGKYDVNYDDGDRSRGLPASKVRKAGARTAGGGGGGGGRGGVARRNDNAPCPGPGLTRRCNGKCVNIQTDSNHCGGCNNRCSNGKRCDGHMFCRDADGNL